MFLNTEDQLKSSVAWKVLPKVIIHYTAIG